MVTVRFRRLWKATAKNGKFPKPPPAWYLDRACSLRVADPSRAWVYGRWGPIPRARRVYATGCYFVSTSAFTGHGSNTRSRCDADVHTYAADSSRHEADFLRVVVCTSQFPSYSLMSARAFPFPRAIPIGTRPPHLIKGNSTAALRARRTTKSGINPIAIILVMNTESHK